MHTFLPFIACNLFVACLIACLASIVGRSGRHAVIAHWLWLAVFIKLITPPIFDTPVTIPHSWIASIQSFYLSANPLPASTDSSPSEAVADSSPGDGSSSGDGSQAVSLGAASISGGLHAGDRLGPDYLLLGMLVWGSGACFIVCRGAWRFVRFLKLLHDESVVNYEANAVVKRLLPNSTHVPPVRLISARISPMLFGIGKHTCIVCPNQLWTSLSRADREAFLAHEVAHFQRRDHWIRWLEWIVTAIYWWLPLVYVARKQLERHEEAACDAVAIASLKALPRAYAEALLNVVDFLSENKVGIPRLASRMQPTETLEERLRLIMSPDKRSLPQSLRWGLFALCLSLMLTHPRLSVGGNVSALSNPEMANRSLQSLGDELKHSAGDSVTGGSSLPNIALPAVPQGWWNEQPRSSYADLRFGDRALNISATAGGGLHVQRSDGATHVFDTDSIGALAYIPNSGRLILGNSAGELHLWDPTASQSVSLIGRHQKAVSSVAFHPRAGLVSGGADGVVSRWDLQSGQLLNNIAFDERICSVRWSQLGDQLAVLTGNWTELNRFSRLHIVHGRTLDSLETIAVPPTTAVVQYHAQQGWLAIDWSGQVTSLASSELIFVVPKVEVTGLVLCQESLDAIELGNPRDTTPPTYTERERNNE